MSLLIKDLYDKSKRLYDRVMEDYPVDEEGQNHYIETVSNLISERQQLVQQVLEMTEMSRSEQRVLEEVLKLDKVIEQRIATVQKKIGSDLSDLKIKKQKGQRYENQYHTSTVDGVFFDKRGV